MHRVLLEGDGVLGQRVAQHDARIDGEHLRAAEDARAGADRDAELIAARTRSGAEQIGMLVPSRFDLEESVRARRLEQHGVRPNGAGQLELEPRATRARRHQRKRCRAAAAACPRAGAAAAAAATPCSCAPSAATVARGVPRLFRARAQHVARVAVAMTQPAGGDGHPQLIGAHTADGVVAQPCRRCRVHLCRERTVAEPAPLADEGREVLRARPPRVHVAQL